MATKLKDRRLSHFPDHHLVVTKAKHYDIVPIFNLIQEGCTRGYFNSLYSLPRYQLRVMLLLLSSWLFGQMRLPSGTWHKASLYVIHHEGLFAGFLLMRYQVPSGESQEIYLCAIEEKYRNKGFARRLIQSVLSDLKDKTIIEAECMHASVHMKHLLRLMGFKSISTPLNSVTEKFRILCTPEH